MREIPMQFAGAAVEDGAVCAAPGRGTAQEDKDTQGRTGSMTRVGHWTSSRVRLVVALAALVTTHAACTPVNDPSAGMSVPEAVALIERTPRSDIQIADLAEAFALGTKSTEVQREQLERAVVGRSVEWEIPVYDVGYSEGRFEVTSQAIPTANRAEAVPMLRVMAFVLVRDERDQQLLMKAKTDDVIRIRGIVQEIRARTIVAIVPTVLVDKST